MNAGHLTAVESGFIVDEDGTTFRVTAGVTRWNGEMAKLCVRHPHVRRLFGLTGNALGGRSLDDSTGRWAERSAPRGTKMRGRPKLRTGPPRLTVALSSSARRTIETEFSATTRFDGLETGGWLFAPATRGWHTDIEVRVATGPGEGAGHSARAYQPSGDYRETEADFTRDGADLCRIGDWHSHPDKHARPSDRDLDCWQNCFLVANEKRDVARYVGLIAALDDSARLPRMRLRAWCLSWDSFGRVTYEPAGISA
jgi:proteasome lid subunit RPN8/RPN11